MMKRCYPLAQWKENKEMFPLERTSHAKAQRRQKCWLLEQLTRSSIWIKDSIYMWEKKTENNGWDWKRGVSGGGLAGRLFSIMLKRLDFILPALGASEKGEQVRVVWMITLSCSRNYFQERGTTGGRKNYC